MRLLWERVCDKGIDFVLKFFDGVLLELNKRNLICYFCYVWDFIRLGCMRKGGEIWLGL